MPPVHDLNDQVRASLEQDDLAGKAIHKLSRKQMRKLSKALLAFCEHMAGMEAHPYQREFARRVILSVLTSDSEDITGLFARQSGKSTILAILVVGLMVMLPLLANLLLDPEDDESDPIFADLRIQKFKKGFWVGIYAPSHEQSNLLFEKILLYLHSDRARNVLADDEIGIEMDSRKDSARAELPNGSKAKCHSAAIQAKIEGSSWHWIIGEEAQDIDPFVWRKSIIPMAASTAGTFTQIGTCTIARSAFYDKCQANARHDSREKDSERHLHFQYDFEVACRHNPWYRIHIKKKMEEMGFDSDEFRMAYRLHWILERGMFVEPTLFELMGKNYSPITYDTTNRVVVGIDVGKSESSTIVTVMMPDYTKGSMISEGDFRSYKRVLNWLDIRGDDYVAQFAQVRDFLVNYRGMRRIMIDATGVGAAMTDMLLTHYASEINAGILEIIPFLASTESNHDGYLRLLQDLQNERFEYPNSERARKGQKQRSFVEQMTNLQKVYRGAYITVEAGGETSYKDYCSSLMLACYACDYIAEGNQRIEESDNFILGNMGGRRNRERAPREASDLHSDRRR